MPIQQLSTYRRGGSVLERNEQLMVTDIANIIAAVNEGGTGEVVGTSIWANGLELLVVLVRTYYFLITLT